MSVPGRARNNPGADNAARRRVSDLFRRSVKEHAESSAENQLWQTAQDAVSNLQRRYVNSQNDGDGFEIDLHDIWYTYYHAAKNTDWQSPMLDRLVLQICCTWELGSVSRGHLLEASVATTSDGVIWTDLPFLAADMLRYWKEDWRGMAAQKRLSFATFTAKLASSGACVRINTIGLTILRDALEVPRALGSLPDEADSTSDAANDTVATFLLAADRASNTVASLLPAANAWLFYAGQKLIQLSDQAWSDDGAAISAGDLFANDALYTGAAVGFGVRRWLFWMKRLEQMSDNARSAGNAPVAEYALRVLENMLKEAEETDSGVRREMRNRPNLVQHRPVPTLMGPARTSDALS